MTLTHPNSPHALVIGSGFGGLAAAVRLGARGYRVTVVEKLDAPGGRAYVHRQDGFTFDAGPTVITAPFLLEQLWQLCGRSLSDDVDMRPVTPFYRIRFHDGQVFDYSGNADAMRDEVRKFSPDDVEGYERFVRVSESIFRVGFERLAHVPFGSWTDMAKIVPEMVRLQSYRTVYGLVSKHVANDRLRQVIRNLLAAQIAALAADEDLRDPKTRLQEILQGRGQSLPVYEVEKVTGLPHTQDFSVTCRIDSLGLVVRGQGPSRRAAEQSAAEQALREHLRDER